MKVVLVLVALATFTQAKFVHEASPVYGYLTKVGIPEAERIRQAEEAILSSPIRVAGGGPAGLGEHPYTAGLLLSLVGINGVAVCGGALISEDRVITAAHCWDDGVNLATSATVVLGSQTLFSGGTRLLSSDIAIHPEWSPTQYRNNLGIIYLPARVLTSGTISPVALPSGSELSENFAGETAVASGYGLTGDGASISIDQVLHHVDLTVITNTVCSFSYPLLIQSSNICTSGSYGTSTCSGDSGGPLVHNIDGRNILIGVASFLSSYGCELGLPSVYSRVSSYTNFIEQHM